MKPFMRGSSVNPVHNSKSVRQDRRGAMLILIAVCLPVMVIFGAFAINVAWMQLTRTELRTATDAAAKAGSRVLSITQDPGIARQWAIDAAALNTVAGTPLTIRPGEVVFGTAARNTAGGYDFATAVDTSPDLAAVRVFGSRAAGSASGPIPLLFQGVFDTGTFEPVKTAVATQLDRDVALVLDRSGSMDTSLGSGTRYTALISAMNAFFDELNMTPQDEIVAICTYSSDSNVDAELSTNYPLLRDIVAQADVAGDTAIGRGMERGLEAVFRPTFSRPLAAKTLVVMTDGNHNTGIDPIDVAVQAAAAGVTVHTITFSPGANQAHMQQVAEAARGCHWHADNQASLAAIFRAVARNLPTILTQ